MNSIQSLDNITIRRFRGIRDLRLSGVGTFNLLLGANGVGKTSVLEAIFMLAAAPNPEKAANVQILRRIAVQEIQDLQWLFRDAATNATIEISAKTSHPVHKRSLAVTITPHRVTPKGDPSSSNAGLRPRSGFDPQSSLHYRTTFEYDSDPSPASIETTLVDRGDRFETIVDPSSRAEDINRVLPMSVVVVPAESGYDTKPFETLIINKDKDRLLQYLGVINADVADIAVTEKAVHLDIGRSKLLPLNLFGAGMVRSAYVLALCLAGGRDILLVDEIENGLHRDAIRPFLEALLALSREGGTQVFATTHRLGVLQELRTILDSERFAEDRQTTKCYALQRDHDGLIRSYRYDHPEFDHCIKHGIEIR